jgi:hypothetical protein
MNRDADMVVTIIGRDCSPIDMTTDKFIPKPSKITAYCKTFLEVNATPSVIFSLFLMNVARSIPMSIENTGPPTIGKSLPKYQAGTAIMRHNAMPRQFVF